MNNSLSELINHATQCFIDLGLSPETIKCYQCSAFHPLERKLENQKNISSSMLMEQEGYFGKQFQEGKISRQTYNWRIRGIRILAEVCDTGRFTWKVYSKKEKVTLTEPFSSVLYSFIEIQNCGQKQKKCRESICRRFLKSLTDNGITFFEDIQAEHVRNFIVKFRKPALKVWMMSSIHSVLFSAIFVKMIYTMITSGCCLPPLVAGIIMYATVCHLKRYPFFLVV